MNPYLIPTFNPNSPLSLVNNALVPLPNSYYIVSSFSLPTTTVTEASQRIVPVSQTLVNSPPIQGGLGNLTNKKKRVWLTEEQKKIIKEAYEKKQKENPGITLNEFNSEYTLEGHQIPRSTLHTIIQHQQTPKLVKQLHVPRKDVRRKAVVNAFKAAKKREQKNCNKLTVPAFLTSINANNPKNLCKVRRWLREAPESPKPQKKAKESQLNPSIWIEEPLNIDFDPNTKFSDIKTRSSRHHSPEEILAIATQFGKSNLNRSQFTAQYAAQHPGEYFTERVLSFVLQQAKKIKVSLIGDPLLES